MASQHISWFKKRWLILIGLFAVGFFDVGTMKSFGVFIEKMTEDFQTSLAVVGLAIGLSHGVAQCFAVVNIPLLKRFGAGKLIVVGSSVSASGFCLIYFATSGIQFLLIMVLTGFGFSTVILPTQVSVLEYFPDHFESATTVVLLGSGVGMMTLPLLTEQLVVAYSWRGAILILGALNFHICITGLLMATSNGPVTQEPSSVEPHNLEEAVSLLHATESVDQSREEDGDTTAAEVDANKSNSGLLDYIASAAKRIFLETFDMKLFFDYPRFIPIYLINFFSALSYCGWIVFLIPNAEDKGIRPDKAVLLATIGGTANICGRLAVGFHTSKFKMSPHIIYCLICILSATSFFSNFFTKSFQVLCCLAAMNGFAMGGKAMSSNFLCKNIVPDERFAAALSFLSLVFGIGEVLWASFLGQWTWEGGVDIG